MSSKAAVLSSEQALDDYFSALLSEEQELELLVSEPSSEIAWQASEHEPELKLQYSEPESYSYAEIEVKELEAPNLEDVQRLLSQLESTNVVDELGIDELLEQNTAQIASLKEEATKPLEQEVFVSQADLVEEIQEWDIADEVEEIQDWTVSESSIAQPTIEEIQPETIVQEQVELESKIEAHIETEPEPKTQTSGAGKREWTSTERSEAFQVLYFEVNSVTFAVPLDELGGIHQMTTLNHLIGRPGWYLGLQTNRDQQLDVVDTAKWVMPDKLKDDEYKTHYQYIVMLGASMWGLASSKLLGTELLYPQKVRWREQSGKRPWLAGMVKEKMCALIHVEALISMLNAGLDVKSLN